MSDVKWIKIVTDIFDDEKIMMIETMPDAYAIIVAWFKLLCLAGKQNNGGILLFNSRIPYTDEMLATIFRMNVNTVRLALEVFERYGMIEIINGTVTIPNWEKHQNVETLDKIREQNRIRKQNERSRKKLLLTDSQTEPHDKPEQADACAKAEEETSETAGGGDSAKCAAGSKKNEPSEPPVYQIPLIDGTMYDVTQTEIDTLSGLYPAVDVMQEIRAIIGWNMANPKRRKTRSGIKRHINSWLSDKQNKSRNVYGTGYRPPRYTPIPTAIPSDDDGEDENPFRR